MSVDPLLIEYRGGVPLLVEGALLDKHLISIDPRASFRPPPLITASCARPFGPSTNFFPCRFSITPLYFCRQ